MRRSYNKAANARDTTDTYKFIPKPDHAAIINSLHRQACECVAAQIHKASPHVTQDDNLTLKELLIEAGEYLPKGAISAKVGEVSLDQQVFCIEALNDFAALNVLPVAVRVMVGYVVDFMVAFRERARASSVKRNDEELVSVRPSIENIIKLRADGAKGIEEVEDENVVNFREFKEIRAAIATIDAAVPFATVAASTQRILRHGVWQNSRETLDGHKEEIRARSMENVERMGIFVNIAQYPIDDNEILAGLRAALNSSS